MHIKHYECKNEQKIKICSQHKVKKLLLIKHIYTYKMKKFWQLNSQIWKKPL